MHNVKTSAAESVINASKPQSIALESTLATVRKIEVSRWFLIRIEFTLSTVVEEEEEEEVEEEVGSRRRRRRRGRRRRRRRSRS